MKYLKKEDYDDLRPNFTNIILAEAKGLVNQGELSSRYYEILSKVYFFLEEILDKKLGLTAIENLFDSAHLKPVFDKDKDIYQYLSNHSYIYIRNTFYIENLMQTDLKRLEETEKLTFEIEKFLLDNLKTIIVPSIINEESWETNYSLFSTEFKAPIDYLVLGIRFQEILESEFDSEDAWFKDYCNKREKIENFKKTANLIFSEKLGYKVHLIEYFPEDIKKKTHSSFGK